MKLYTIESLAEYESNEKIIAYHHNGIVDECWKNKVAELIFVKEYTSIDEFLKDHSCSSMDEYHNEFDSYISVEEKEIIKNFFENKSKKIYVLEVENKVFESYLYDESYSPEDILNEGLDFLFSDYQKFKWSE